MIRKILPHKDLAPIPRGYAFVRYHPTQCAYEVALWPLNWPLRLWYRLWARLRWGPEPTAAEYLQQVIRELHEARDRIRKLEAELGLLMRIEAVLNQETPHELKGGHHVDV